MQLSEKERVVLSLVQGDLPDTATPFLDIARQAGVSESEVLELLQRLKDNGGIRRFGATLRHQKAGYGANAMVAWYVEDERDVNEIGEIMAARPEVSHCYHRKSCLDWPYQLYTMIHAKTAEECGRAVKEISEATGLTQFDILLSRKELKKTSMQYF